MIALCNDKAFPICYRLVLERSLPVGARGRAPLTKADPTGDRSQFSEPSGHSGANQPVLRLCLNIQLFTLSSYTLLYPVLSLARQHVAVH